MLFRTARRVAAATLLSLLVFGCGTSGSGTILSESRDIEAATEVEYCCGFQMKLVQGDSPELELTGDDNLLSEIGVFQEGSKLEIRWEDPRSSYNPSQPPRIELTLPAAERVVATGGSSLVVAPHQVDDFAVELSGGGELALADLRSGSFELTMSGGGEADANGLVVEEFLLDSSGGGSITTSGRSPVVTASLSSGGLLEAFDLSADDVSLDLSGGSEAEVSAESSLTVTASGGSRVVYDGDPSVEIKEDSGGSTVEKR